MDITIREMKTEDLELGIHLSGSFNVDSILSMHAEGKQICYTVQEVPPYIKTYDDEELTADTHLNYINNPDQTVYLAFAGNKAVGQLVLKRNWNKYAYIDYIKIDTAFS